MTTRKQYSPKFKVRVVIGAMWGEKTLNPLGSTFGVYPAQIAPGRWNKWKRYSWMGGGKIEPAKWKRRRSTRRSVG
jgi:hypothetical protein